MAQQAATKPRSANGLPFWNTKPFTCPGLCARTFEPFKIRLKYHGRTLLCHACYNDTTGYGGQASQRAQRTTGTRAEHTTALATLQAAPCHTCGVAFAGRRIVTNTNGNLVHYRCPPKKRTHTT